MRRSNPGRSKNQPVSGIGSREGVSVGAGEGVAVTGGMGVAVSIAGAGLQLQKTQLTRRKRKIRGAVMSVDTLFYFGISSSARRAGFKPAITRISRVCMQIQVHRSGYLSSPGQKQTAAANFANSRRFFNQFVTTLAPDLPSKSCVRRSAGVRALRGKEKDFAYIL